MPAVAKVVPEATRPGKNAAPVPASRLIPATGATLVTALAVAFLFAAGFGGLGRGFGGEEIVGDFVSESFGAIF